MRSSALNFSRHFSGCGSVRVIFSSLLILLSIQLPAFADAAKEEVAAATVKEDPVEITSDNAEMDFAGKIAVFSGNVRVRDRDFRLQSDKMTVNFTEDDQLEKIVASGNVLINDRDDTRRATGGVAVYTPGDGQIIITETPEITDGKNIMKNSERIIFFRNDDRVLFEGLQGGPRPTLIIEPGEGRKLERPGTGKK